MTFSTFASPGVSLQGGGGSGGGGGGTPGGSNTQIQYNNSGAFAGASGLTTNGTELTIASGTKTASAPVLDMSQTWNNAAVTFTGLKLNITDTASNAASLLMDLQRGTVSQFSVNRIGTVTFSNGAVFSTAGGMDFGTNTVSRSGAINFGPSSDASITRRGTANLRLGTSDVAAPVAQTLSVQSVVTGTSNIAGANLTITGSQGTGTGAGGSIIFQVAPAGSSGSAQNALVDALTIASNRSVTIAAGSATLKRGLTANYLIYENAGLDVFQVTGGEFNLVGNALLTWGTTNNTFTGYTADVILRRDAANTLALRNGNEGQTFNIYDTYTNTSNYRRASMYWSGGAFYIDNDVNAGTGITNATLYVKTRGNLHLVAGAGGYDVVTNGNSGGSLYPGGTTNTTGFGRSDKTWSNGFFGTSVQLAPATAIPAGGTAGLGYRVSSTANFGVFFGSGAPTLSAAKGSLYLRSDGSTTNDRMYVNTDGATTWTAVQTVA